EFEQAIARILQKANCQAGDIDLVLRTGGSSLIPAVKDILDNQFSGKVVEHDPFTSVAAGLAIADYYQYAESDLS
ncbi:Hsp70 family protein, partial [Porticoccaceae bacterium]|nr:Hsp70 family protein [Porticoccaceae bacterium]